ncbi:hypothetical protein [Phascolarctobacterium sp.]
MTPERKQWWDRLPQREKMLREQILAVKSEISWAKHRLRLISFTPKAIKLIISQMKRQKVVLTALKHELDRTTKKVAYKNYNGLTEYRCEKCGGTIFEVISQSHCCWCGRKIVGCK